MKCSACGNVEKNPTKLKIYKGTCRFCGFTKELRKRREKEISRLKGDDKNESTFP